MNHKSPANLRGFFLLILFVSHSSLTFAPHTSRSRAAVARRAHNPKVGGSIPPFATEKAHLLVGFFN
jgi:hypothetical protein